MLNCRIRIYIHVYFFEVLWLTGWPIMQEASTFNHMDALKTKISGNISSPLEFKFCKKLSIFNKLSLYNKMYEINVNFFLYNLRVMTRETDNFSRTG